MFTFRGAQMSEAMLAKAVRQAAQQVSIAVFCAAITMSILMPICAVIVARTAMKWQAEEMRQSFEAARQGK